MADSGRKLRSDGQLLLPAVSALIEAGDLCFYSAGSAAPASSQTDQGSEPLNQQEFKRLFLGVSMQRSPSGTTDNILVDVSPSSEYQFDCPSTQWNVGDLVGASENSAGDGLEDQQVELVTDPAEAIGISLQEDSAVTTTVRCLLFSSYAGFAGLLRGSLSGVNVETLTGARTIAAGEPQLQILDPGGAGRTVTLPAEAEGLDFTIVNAADGDEPLTVNNDAAGKQALIERGGRARFVSDGTSWFVFGSRQQTHEVNAETLAANKTGAITDALYQHLDPGGADRFYDLPAEAAAVGLGPIVVFNAADADETITVREDSGTTVLATLDRGCVGVFLCDGTTWSVLSGGNQGPAVNVETLAGTKTLDGTSPLVQILDPDGAVRKVLMPTEAVAKGRGVYRIVNNATAGVGFAETMSIKEDSDTTFIKYLRPGEAVELVSDGTAWHILSETFGNKNQQEAQSTVAAALTLTDAMMPVQRITTDNNATITLPAEAGTNRSFLIAHVSGAHTCAVQNDAAGGIITDIGVNEAGFVWSDGTNWYGETFQLT